MMSKTMTVQPITDEQREKYKQYIEDAANKALLEAELGKDGLQKLVENGDEFQTCVTTCIKEFLVSNQCTNEKVCFSYSYPKEYKGPRPIIDQIKISAEIFDLDPSNALEFAKNLPQLPNDTEEWVGWFAVPSVDAIAEKHFPKVLDPADKYCHAVQFVHRKIAATRSFYHYRGNHLTPKRLRVSARTAQAFDLIAKKQPGDIHIVAAQLGMRYRGRSIHHACEAFVPNEFGLGSLAVGSIALVHPERLVRWEQLDMVCIGDEFAPSGDGDFSYALSFIFYDGGVRLLTRYHHDVSKFAGFISAFVL